MNADNATPYMSPFVRTALAVLIGALVGGCVGGLIAWGVTRNHYEREFFQNQIVCTLAGADDMVNVDIPLDDLEGADSVELRVITGTYPGDSSIVLVREEAPPSSEDVVDPWWVSIPMSKMMVESISEVSLQIARSDDGMTYNTEAHIKNPNAIQVFPNGPDCEPHVAQIRLALVDGELVAAPDVE